MDALRNLTTWIEAVNVASGGTFLPVAAGVLVLLLIAAISWMWRRLRHIPEPPNRVERILREDAAQRPMTCEEARAYFGLAGVHDVFKDGTDD